MTLTVPGESRPFVDLRDAKVATSLTDLLYGQEKLAGNVHVVEMRLIDLRIQDVSADLHWENKILTLDPVKASLYNGTMQGTAHGSDLFTVPNWNWEVQLNNVQIKPLMQDVNGADSKVQISGAGQVNMKASTQGKAREEMLGHLNGNCSFSVNNGAVEGVDLNYFVQAANALINGQSLPSPAGLNQTAFNTLTGTLTITNGLAETKDLQLTSPAFVTSAQGNVKLVSQVLDFQLQIKPVETVKFNWQIPVLISGSLTHPDVRLDTDAVRKLVSKEDIDKLKSKAMEKIKERVPQAGKLLQNLLGH